MGTPDAYLLLGEFIRAQRQMARLSLRQMARMSGLSDSYLSQIERGMYRPSAEALKAIADALDLSSSALFAQVGLLDDNSDADVPSVETAVRLDRKLTPRQKETLLQVYRTLIGTLD
jgi:transcriptional regulator with XRE-family HTH domain